jgi:lysyl-tRNA synthetase class 2
MSEVEPEIDAESGRPDAGVSGPDAEASEPGVESEGERTSRLELERAARLAKLEAHRRDGREPYPYRFERTATLGEVRADHGHLPPGTETSERVRVAGRIVLLRRQGKLTFATLRDRSGDLQLFVSRAVIGEPEHTRFDDLDLGDWVGVEGTVMTTRKGELSVKVESFELLAKALRPLPDKWRGLSDVDTRYRQRYVDLIVNDEARRVFAVRHAVVASIRRTLDERGYYEVETPVLHVEAGGAHARPFTTFHNTLDMELYLRIALELHLKRLIVGGLERVFEIGRVFRNEGVSTRHNPEFSMLEAYEAFADYHDMMELTEDLVVAAARDALGTTVVTIDGEDVDLAQPWRRAPMLELISEAVGRTIHPSLGADELAAVAKEHGVSLEPHMGPGAICMALYDDLVEPKLRAPTFVLDYPMEVSPLARTHRDDPWLVERFELVVGGRELANAYSELNDPIEQRQRFEDEQAAKEAGNLEAGTVDEDYLRALEYGMPPCGGLGIGIDRLAMLLAGVGSIKEVILFPTLRPER